MNILPRSESQYGGLALLSMTLTPIFRMQRLFETASNQEIPSEEDGEDIEDNGFFSQTEAEDSGFFSQTETEAEQESFTRSDDGENWTGWKREDRNKWCQIRQYVFVHYDTLQWKYLNFRLPVNPFSEKFDFFELCAVLAESANHSGLVVAGQLLDYTLQVFSMQVRICDMNVKKLVEDLNRLHRLHGNRSERQISQSSTNCASVDENGEDEVLQKSSENRLSVRKMPRTAKSKISNNRDLTYDFLKERCENVFSRRKRLTCYYNEMVREPFLDFTNPEDFYADGSEMRSYQDYDIDLRKSCTQLVQSMKKFSSRMDMMWIPTLQFDLEPQIKSGNRSNESENVEQVENEDQFENRESQLENNEIQLASTENQYENDEMQLKNSENQPVVNNDVENDNNAENHAPIPPNPRENEEVITAAALTQLAGVVKLRRLSKRRKRGLFLNNQNNIVDEVSPEKRQKPNDDEESQENLMQVSQDEGFVGSQELDRHIDQTRPFDQGSLPGDLLDSSMSTDEGFVPPELVASLGHSSFTPVTFQSRTTRVDMKAVKSKFSQIVTPALKSNHQISFVDVLHQSGMNILNNPSQGLESASIQPNASSESSPEGLSVGVAFLAMLHNASSQKLFLVGDHKGGFNITLEKPPDVRSDLY